MIFSAFTFNLKLPDRNLLGLCNSSVCGQFPKGLRQGSSEYSHDQFRNVWLLEARVLPNLWIQTGGEIKGIHRSWPV